MNVTTNFLLGATSCHHPRTTIHQKDSFIDNVVHDIDDIRLSRRRASGTQSFGKRLSLTSPSTTMSYPRLQEYFTQQISSSNIFIPSNVTKRHSITNRSQPICASLHQINNSLPSQSNQMPTTDSKNMNIFIPTTKSSDEYAVVDLTKDTSAIINNSNRTDNTINKSEPIEIRVQCIFSRVGEIDTLNERYTAEIFFEASWYDDDRKIGLKYDPQMGHFNPQLVILNHIGDSLRHEKWYSINRTNEEHVIEIVEHHKIRGVFWERMELNHFPYDVQELSLSLTTPLSTDEICFIQNKKKPSGVNRTVFSDEQSWHLYEHVEFGYNTHHEEYSLNYNRIHPVVVCTCHVGRKCGYYIWNAYFLIFLITSAALCTFAIPPSNAHGRLQITSTLLLTSVTFRWVVNKSLPTISYLTALDIYAISSIVVLCIINIFHGIMSYIYYNQIYSAASRTPVTANDLNLSLYPEYTLCRLDRYAFFIICSLFCIFQLIILFCTTWVPYKRRREMSYKDQINAVQQTNS